MKTLRQLIFIFLAVTGLTLAVSAQKDEQKKPPKQAPPVVTPGKPKPPKGEKPPKKPEMSYFIAGKQLDLDPV